MGRVWVWDTHHFVVINLLTFTHDKEHSYAHGWLFISHSSDYCESDSERRVWERWILPLKTLRETSHRLKGTEGEVLKSFCLRTTPCIHFSLKSEFWNSASELSLKPAVYWGLRGVMFLRVLHFFFCGFPFKLTKANEHIFFLLLQFYNLSRMYAITHIAVIIMFKPSQSILSSRCKSKCLTHVCGATF